MIEEWIARGYKNTMQLYNLDNKKLIAPKSYFDPSHYMYIIQLPLWLNDNFCSHHRATLLFKNFEYYSQFGWTEEPKYKYIWPTKVEVNNANVRM